MVEVRPIRSASWSVRPPTVSDARNSSTAVEPVSRFAPVTPCEIDGIAGPNEMGCLIGA